VCASLQKESFEEARGELIGTPAPLFDPQKDWSKLQPMPGIKRDPLTFRRASVELSPDSIEKLHDVAKTMQSLTDCYLEIQGVPRGDSPADAELAQKRADDVLAWLRDVGKVEGLCTKTAGLPRVRQLPAGTLTSGSFPSAQGCPRESGNELPQALAFSAVGASKFGSLVRVRAEMKRTGPRRGPLPAPPVVPNRRFCAKGRVGRVALGGDPRATRPKTYQNFNGAYYLGLIDANDQGGPAYGNRLRVKQR